MAYKETSSETLKPDVRDWAAGKGARIPGYVEPSWFRIVGQFEMYLSCHPVLIGDGRVECLVLSNVSTEPSHRQRGMYAAALNILTEIVDELGLGGLYILNVSDSSQWPIYERREFQRHVPHQSLMGDDMPSFFKPAAGAVVN